MAIYDNKHWLLSHIRNSFISTDDTGMCEMVMLGEDFPKLLHAKCVAERGKIELSTPSKTADDSSDDDYKRERIMDFDCYPEMDQSDEDDMDPLAESYDLQHDMDFGMHRQRSNTAQKLEKMELAQRKAAKIRMVKWETPSSAITDQEREQLFVKKESKPTPAKGRSLLAEQLAKCPFLPQSKFLDYAKFDGTAQLGLPTKTYKIFMTMVPEDQRNYPILVCVVASAKILDLIGFTCYKYSIAHPDVILGSVSNYGLYICEDDGEVDWDFPCLDSREACSKFGLTCLGLVDMKTHATLKHSEIHTSSIPEKGGFHVIMNPDDKGNVEQGSRSRSATFDSKEKPQETIGVKMTFTKVLGGKGNQVNTSVTFGDDSLKTRQVLVDNLQPMASSSVSHYEELSAKSRACSSPQDAEALSRMKDHEKVIEAPQYQSYKVRMANRVRANTQVLLGISGERIEIDPIYSGSNKFWPRMKPISYSMDTVAWCEVIEFKSNRSTFRIIYSATHGNTLNQEPSPSSGLQTNQSLLHSSNLAFKHHDFECEVSMGKEIVEKINRILELQSSPCRKEYRSARERKAQARRSFHLSRTS